VRVGDPEGILCSGALGNANASKTLAFAQHREYIGHHLVLAAAVHQNAIHATQRVVQPIQLLDGLMFVLARQHGAHPHANQFHQLVFFIKEQRLRYAGLCWISHLHGACLLPVHHQRSHDAAVIRQLPGVDPESTEGTVDACSGNLVMQHRARQHRCQRGKKARHIVFMPLRKTGEFVVALHFLEAFAKNEE